MAMVHTRPWWWAAGGAVGLALTALLVPLSVGGWAAGLAFLAVSAALVSAGLARSKADRFGAGNAVTATRSALIGVVAALVATSLTEPIPPLLLAALVAPALALDAVDGWAARRTGTVTPLGARFDMEADAFLILVLSVYDVRIVGAWVLAIGLMRYAFVAAGWLFPWLRATVPFRYWRKVVAAACGITLAAIATGVLPSPVDVVVGVTALALLVESFGRDVIWLTRMNFRARPLVTSP
ncbi:MAG: CDP-alcohol phosphatidyltransferase family protein [Leifsonia sp.]